jgi:triosephosphate isomerase (TIM)
MSTRRTLIAGNWKMNLTPETAVELAGAIRDGLATRACEADVVVGPTNLCLKPVADLLVGSGIGVAGQNLYPVPSGAFTGEVSGEMLTAAGAGWVILGHSERRTYFGETDAGVAQKAGAAIKAGLLPILCVGETLEEREAGRTLEVILGQTGGVIEGLSESELELCTLAYEPIWAIGTGKVATTEQAQEVHAAMRGFLAGNLGDKLAGIIRILYGGSVKPDNVVALMGQEDIDGALVGGASLTGESFLALIPPFQTG